MKLIYYNKLQIGKYEIEAALIMVRQERRIEHLGVRQNNVCTVPDTGPFINRSVAVIHAGINSTLAKEIQNRL